MIKQVSTQGMCLKSEICTLGTRQYKYCYFHGLRYKDSMSVAYIKLSFDINKQSVSSATLLLDNTCYQLVYGPKSPSS